MMDLSSKMTLALSTPVTLALISMFMIAYADGRESMWWVRMMITFVIAAVLVGRTTWLGHQHHRLDARNRVLEERDILLSKRLRILEHKHNELRQDVHARLASRELRRAVGSPVRLVDPEEN